MAKKQKVEFSISTIIANEVTKKQLQGYIEEIVLSKNKAKDANAAIKDIKDEAKNSLGIPGKILNNLVKEYLDDGSIEHQITELEEAKGLSDALK